MVNESLFHTSFENYDESTLAHTSSLWGSKAHSDRRDLTESCGHYFTPAKEPAGTSPDACPDIDAVAERRRHGPGSELITLGYEGSDIDYTRFSRRRKKKE